MPSNDEFRAHRHLIRDTMSPAFLHDVVAPAIHSSMQDLLELWRQRIRLAPGRPFRADQDIIRSVVDLILLATFGMQTGLSRSQHDLLAGVDTIDAPADADVPAAFPEAGESVAYTAIRTLVDSIQIGMNSPIPKLHMQFALRFYPALSAARKHTDNLMTAILQAAWQKVATSDGGDPQFASAVDLLVQREAQTAAKQNRDVRYDTRVIRDELFGFYLTGHETTSTTICWAVKHLTAHPDVQRKLRVALRAAHARAAETGRLPTAREIVEANVPYLDAFIEENHRLGTAIPAVIRRATRDVVVLGHWIPAGTDVFMLLNGPGFQRPAFPIDDAKRSPTARESKERYGVWKDGDVDRFIPERFLVEDERGAVKFNPFAGPALPYGAGLRGCFGKVPFFFFGTLAYDFPLFCKTNLDFFFVWV